MIGVDNEAIISLVRRASALALSYFRSEGHQVDSKVGDGFDPVTAADREIEALLRHELALLVGPLPVIGEEQGTTGDPSVGPAWIIDPIDGTRAFISGQPQWGTLLGLLHDGRPVGGWMHLPVLNETYFAFDGIAGVESPTTSRLKTSECTDLADATMASTHPSMFVGGLRDRFDRLESAVRLSRFGGDCHNYGLLASGDIDLVVESQMRSYDILPLVPIIHAAGGVVTDGTGSAPLHGGTIVAAATASLHAEALDLLA